MGGLAIAFGFTALLYAAGSQRGLLEALRRALSEAETCRRLADRGRREVLEHRTWLRTCAPYPELYARLLGRRLGYDEPASAPAPGPQRANARE